MEEDLEHFPMPDEFYGFGDETPIPGRLKIITKGDGDSEELVKVVHEIRKGLEKGTTEDWKKVVVHILLRQPHLLYIPTKQLTFQPLQKSHLVPAQGLRYSCWGF